MKLSSQEEYGLRCLLQVARSGESLTIAELSRLEGISSPNVAKILRLLRRGGFLTATRGQAGGYTLARSADQIAVGDVLATLGGRLFDSGFCETHAGTALHCLHLRDCSIRPVLRTIQTAIDDVLGQLTLQSLICPEREVALGSRAIPLRMARDSGAPA
jgi:Rrf2 family transcriptional regulator, cysteine metabolism repressor